jgi:hypothetical protein
MQLAGELLLCVENTHMHCYVCRHWSDAGTKVPNLMSSTSTWGGCYPHMQIIHKGMWHEAVMGGIVVLL